MSDPANQAKGEGRRSGARLIAITGQSDPALATCIAERGGKYGVKTDGLV